VKSDDQSFKARAAKARHDLRNPLSDILGFSEVLQEEAAERRQSDLVPHFEAIRDSASRILAEVNHALGADNLQGADSDLLALEQTVHVHAKKILETADTLSERYDELGLDALGDDLLRITGSARRLRDGMSALLADLRAAHPHQETAAAPDPVGGDSPAGDRGHTGDPEENSSQILVVDDNESNRALLARRLRRQGHTVSLAENGRQAIEKLGKRRFDLLLLDIVMPEMDGVEVLKWLKADPGLQNIPVIMLSAMDELETVVRCIALGAEDYLPKPFPTPLLQARVRACLKSKRMSDQLRRYTEWLFGRALFAQAVAKPESLALCRQDRAVLFADIRGFTRWSEPRAPEEVVAMLNRYFEVAERIWIRSPVIKTEYTGDEVMAVFPSIGDAVSVALDLRLELGRFLDPLGLKIGAGIHAGPVIEGLVGSTTVKEYCFVGDTVNTARRICDHAAADEILISHAAEAMGTTRLALGPPRFLEVQGKSGPVQVFPVLGPAGV
jgi:CheY-like chemotaxis protein